MTAQLCDRLLLAIERDEVGSFHALMNEAPCGTYRMGRFPVLSLLYLFGARKILFSYEEKLMKIAQWEDIGEPVSVAGAFAKQAGKCLRLYLSEIVSPLEMLLILEKTGKLKKLYPKAKASKEVRERLKAIYSIRYALGIKFEGENILIPRPPMNRGQKKRALAIGLACVMAAAALIVTPVTCNAYLGKRSGGDVTRLSHIDFAAKTTYVLKKDIKIPSNYSAKKVNCTIVGEGHKLIFGKKATLGELGGSISGVEIETAGSPVFTACAQGSTLSDITLNVKADITSSEGTAFVALNNLGTMENITVNVSGKLRATAGKNDGTQTPAFGGMVMENAYSSRNVYGTIQNCTVNYLDFTLEGVLEANATFGGIAGLNYGTVERSRVTGTITADTFDVAGACYGNGGTLTKIVNEADLAQVAHISEWTPVVSGIANENAGLIELCENKGKLSLEGVDEADCGGIVARNYGDINYCISSGDIFAKAKKPNVGNIFGVSTIVTDESETYLRALGFVDSCIGAGKIEIDLLEDGTAYVGGIGGYVPEKAFSGSYYGGGVTNCIFLGEIGGNFDYRGSIVGVCGRNVYSANSYELGGEPHVPFKGNYYTEGGPSAFGGLLLQKKVDKGDGKTETEEEFSGNVNDKGATPMERERLLQTKLYLDIIEKIFN